MTSDSRRLAEIVRQAKAVQMASPPTKDAIERAFRLSHPPKGKHMTDESPLPINTKMRTRRIMTPRLNIEVTREQIEKSKRADSRACMVAEAIKAKHPWAMRVDVDFVEIRVTDPVKNLRFIYRTPRLAAEALLRFDQGVDVEPFHCRTVQATHVIRHSQMVKKAKTDAGLANLEAEASADGKRRRRADRRAAVLRSDDGQLTTSPEYSEELRRRMADPAAPLGPSVPLSPHDGNHTASPVMVGGRPPKSFGKPGQMKTRRMFGVRDFWRGDGSGVAGILKERDKGDR